MRNNNWAHHHAMQLINDLGLTHEHVADGHTHLERDTDILNSLFNKVTHIVSQATPHEMMDIIWHADIPHLPSIARQIDDYRPRSVMRETAEGYILGSISCTTSSPHSSERTSRAEAIFIR